MDGKSLFVLSQRVWPGKKKIVQNLLNEKTHFENSMCWIPTSDLMSNHDLFQESLPPRSDHFCMIRFQEAG